MNTLIGIGFSQNIDIRAAATEAVTQAQRQTRQRNIDLAIVFSTIHYNPEEFLPVMRQLLPDTRIMGCSTAGVMTAKNIFLRGIAVLAIYSEDISFSCGCVNNINSMDMEQAGSQLARNTVGTLIAHHRKAFLYFTDGLLHDHANIVHGLQAVLGNVFAIVGAGSSDDFHFKKTYQFFDDKIMTNAAVGLLLGGKLNIGLGSRHGWKPLGKPRTIDKTNGNIIQLIDGKAAACIYDEYFGAEAISMRTSRLGQMAILYPLGIYQEGEREHLLRTAIHVQKDGSILCQGVVPEGSEVHIMLSSKDACIQAAADAALTAQQALGGKPAQLVLIIESLARHKLLGRSALKEILAIREIFGEETPILGMYSHGEIYPAQTTNDKSAIHLQNESITVMAIG